VLVVMHLFPNIPHKSNNAATHRNTASRHAAPRHAYHRPALLFLGRGELIAVRPFLGGLVYFSAHILPVGCMGGDGFEFAWLFFLCPF
jgi:hypothetical protein